MNNKQKKFPSHYLCLIAACALHMAGAGAAPANTNHCFGAVTMIRDNSGRHTRSLVKSSDGTWLEFGRIHAPAASNGKPSLFKWYAASLDKSFLPVRECLDSQTDSDYTLAAIPNDDDSIITVNRNNVTEAINNPSADKLPHSTLAIETMTAKMSSLRLVCLPCEARDFFLHGCTRGNNHSIVLYGMSSAAGTFLPQNLKRDGVFGFVHSVDPVNSKTWTHVLDDGLRSYVTSSILKKDGRLAIAGGVVTKRGPPVKQGISENYSYGLLQFLDSNGKTTGERTFNSTKAASVSRIAESSDGGLIIAGSYVGELKCGEFSATNQSNAGTFYVGSLSKTDELRWLFGADGGHTAIMKILPLKRDHFLILMENYWSQTVAVFKGRNLKPIGEKNLTLLLMNGAGDFLGSTRIAGVVGGDFASYPLLTVYADDSKDVIVVFSAKGNVSLGEPTKLLGKYDQFRQFFVKCPVDF